MGKVSSDPRRVNTLPEMPWRNHSLSSRFISCLMPAEMDQLLHSGCLMWDFHLPPHRAGLSSASINSPRPSKELHETRCLRTAGVTQGDSRLTALQSGILCQHLQPRQGLQADPLPCSSQRACLAIPGRAPFCVRAISWQAVVSIAGWGVSTFAPRPVSSAMLGGSPVILRPRLIFCKLEIKQGLPSRHPTHHARFMAPVLD